MSYAWSNGTGKLIAERNEQDYDAADIDRELIASRLQKDVVSSIPRRRLKTDLRPRRKAEYIRILLPT